MRRLAMVALLAASCGGKATMGEVCDKTGEALCWRVHMCYGAAVEYASCFQAFKQDCCLKDGTCQKEPEQIDDTDAFLKACVPALQTAECSTVRDNVLPPVCLMSY